MKSPAEQPSIRPIRPIRLRIDAELLGVTALGICAVLFSLSFWDLVLKIAVSAATLAYILLKICKLLRPTNPYDDED